jgi:hypothetical protein
MSDEVYSPSEKDWDWLGNAEEHILGLLRGQYGSVELEHTQEDLYLAQRLIDDGAVGRDQTVELECLGVVLGNVFATQTSLEWALVSNELGTLLALHSPEIGCTIYPLTMIANRMEEGREVDLPGLYRSCVTDWGL